MNHIKKIVGVLMLLFITAVTAQQDPNFIFYRYNMNVINPAYAGSVVKQEVGSVPKRVTQLGLNLRSQWSGVQGAPETQSIFFSTGLAKNLGFGVSVINDRTFIENQTWITADFSYKVKFNENTNLFLGVKAGGNSYNANLDGLTSFGIAADPSTSDIQGVFNPTFGLGALLQGERFFVTVSVPNVLTSERLQERDGEAKLGQSRQHFYLGGGMDFEFSNDFILKPSVVARYVDSSPFTIDFTAAFELEQKFEFGLNYRLNEGIGGLFMFKGTDWIDFGYAYEAPSASPIVQTTNGSHEVVTRFTF
jgi:type IX secretion system PorP/SprF family membrane protein